MEDRGWRERNVGLEEGGRKGYEEVLKGSRGRDRKGGKEGEIYSKILTCISRLWQCTVYENTRITAYSKIKFTVMPKVKFKIVKITYLSIYTICLIFLLCEFNGIYLY